VKSGSSLRHVPLRGRTRLPVDGLLWNFIFDYFWKICRENLSFIKFWQEYRVLCMKTYVHLWQYLAEFFLEWEMFQTIDVEKIKTHILYSITFFSENHAVYRIMWKNMVGLDRLQITVQYGAYTFVLCNLGYTHALKIFNNYCFSTTTIVTWTPLNVKFICTLPVLLCIKVH
jgi:hypothetical protein